MDDFLTELNAVIGNEETEKQPEAPQPNPEFDAMSQRLQQLETALKEVEERNRKLTQLALGDEPQVTAEKMQEYIQKDPVGYTNSVVETTTKRAQELTAQQIAEVREQMVQQAAIDRAKQKYPELQQFAEYIAIESDKVVNGIQSGTLKHIQPNDYDAIIEESVKQFRQRASLMGSRQPLNQVMALDVGNSSNVYGNQGNQDTVAKINNMTDAQLEQMISRVKSQDRPSPYTF